MRIPQPISFLEERIASRPPSYADELAPAIVERTDTEIVIDDEHPAFIALKAKYAPTPEQLAAQEAACRAWLLNRYHELWDDLHTRREWTPEKMERFTAIVPCGECREHFLKLLKKNPPPYEQGDDAVFVWTVWAHDDVNVHRGVPVFGLAAARTKYNR